MGSGPALDNGTAYRLLAESQEDRLQRVEGAVQDVSADVRVLTERISTSSEHLDEKIGQILTQVQATNNKVEAMHGTMEKQDRRVETLEGHDKSRTKTWGTAKKAVYGLLFTTAGVLAKHFGTALWILLFVR